MVARQALLAAVGIGALAAAASVEARPFPPTLRSAGSTNASVVTEDINVVKDQPYDWIVLGGGLAGLVLANRLSDDNKTRVLVVEAGGDNRTSPEIASIAAYGQALTTTSGLDWMYNTTEQIGGNKSFDAGKTLGGSSSVNGGTWCRAAVEQYDSFANYSGNHVYAWTEFLPYLKAVENYTVPTDSQQAQGTGKIVPSLHGEGGLVQVSYTPADGSVHPNSTYQPAKRMYTDGYSQAYSAASKAALGTSINQTDPSATGDVHGLVSFVPNSIATTPADPDSVTRSSSATAYLSPIEFTRENLHVLVGWRGARALFNDSSDPKRVTGAEIQRAVDEAPVALNASAGVIVAAGALGSSQILERSGVGNATVLKAAGVTPIVDLPGVGLNLHDQTKISIVSVNKKNYTGVGPSNTLGLPNVHQLMSNASDVQKWYNAHKKQWANDTVANGGAVSAEALLKQWDVLEQNIWSQNVSLFEYFVDYGSTTGFGQDAWILIPFSRGSIHIADANPFTQAVIDPQFFSVPLDWDITVAGWRGARKISQTAPLSDWLGEEVAPGNKTVPFDEHYGDYTAWQQWGQAYLPVAHQIGTAQMAPRELGGVVKPDGSVYGVSNGTLRVVDGATIPFQLSSHLSATIYAMAERFAQDITGRSPL